jgi:hypothetical protein
VKKLGFNLGFPDYLSRHGLRCFTRTECHSFRGKKSGSRTTVIETVVPVEHCDRKEQGIEREEITLSSETTSSRQMGKEGSFV